MKIFNKGSERRDPDTTRIPAPFSRVSRLPNFCHRFIPNTVSFPNPASRAQILAKIRFPGSSQTLYPVNFSRILFCTLGKFPIPGI